MHDLVFLMEIIKELPKNLFNEKEILQMIVRNSKFGIMFEIEIDPINKQIIYVINNDVTFYDHFKDSDQLKQLKRKYYVFYLKRDDIELLKYILNRFF